MRVYEKNIGGGIPTTDFNVRARQFEAGQSEQLWYIPNEIGGVTMMKPMRSQRIISQVLR